MATNRRTHFDLNRLSTFFFSDVLFKTTRWQTKQNKKFPPPLQKKKFNSIFPGRFVHRRNSRPAGGLHQNLSFDFKLLVIYLFLNEYIRIYIFFFPKWFFADVSPASFDTDAKFSTILSVLFYFILNFFSPGRNEKQKKEKYGPKSYVYLLQRSSAFVSSTSFFFVFRFFCLPRVPVWSAG